MALRPPRLTTTAAPEAEMAAIPTLVDDPRYAAAARVHRTLQAANERAEAEIDLIVLQEHLDGQPVTSTPSPRNELLRDRMHRRVRELAESAPDPAEPVADEKSTLP